jgi:hypothetical protein
MREGYAPAETSDLVYFHDRSCGFVELDAGLRALIQAGRVRL